MISKFLYLLLLHCSRVLDHKVVDWQCCRNCSLVCYHVEVKAAVAVHWAMLDKTSVDNSTWRWVCIGVALFLDESGVDLLVN